jgi:hypothetical protein
MPERHRADSAISQLPKLFGFDRGAGTLRDLWDAEAILRKTN